MLVSVSSKASEVSRRESDSFQSKMRMLNFSELRKSKFGGGKNRDQMIQDNSNLIAYLRTFKELDQNKLANILPEDDDFLEKIKKVIDMNIRRLTQDKMLGNPDAEIGNYEQQQMGLVKPRDISGGLHRVSWCKFIIQHRLLSKQIKLSIAPCNSFYFKWIYTVHSRVLFGMLIYLY